MILRPSAAGRWTKCPGSASLEALFPEDVESPAAREGTAAHWYVSEALHGVTHPVGAVAPNGVPLDAEMIEAGQMMVDTVHAAYGPDTDTWIEEPFTMHGLIHHAVQGTPDVAIIDLTNHRLHIVDFKYGHRYVDAYRNLQLLCYAAGVFERAELTRDEAKGWEVNLTIVQPRCFTADPVRTWTELGHRVWPLFDDIAWAAEGATGPNPVTHTGEHCRDCEGRHACEAIARTGAYACDIAGSSLPQELSTTAYALELRLLDTCAARLEARRTALAEVVSGKLRAGERVPGWAIEHPPGREKWTVPVEDVIATADAFGVDVRKPLDVITPAQARKLKLDGSVIDAYSERPKGAAKLVAVDTDRLARRMFGDV